MAFGQLLRRGITKLKSDTIFLGFQEQYKWISTGNYALNRLITGDHRKAFCFGKSVVIGGISGSGKSLIYANACGQAQKDHNAFIVWMDAEHASEEDWFVPFLDTSEDNFLRVELTSIEDVKQTWKIVQEAYKSDSRPIVFVIDSYSVLMTESQMEAVDKGIVKGDQGQQAKQLKDLAKGLLHQSARKNIAVLGIVHTMAPVDKYSKETMTGGRGLIYLASMAFIFQSKTLRNEDVEDKSVKWEKGNEKRSAGIKSEAWLVKSRYAKPNETVEIQIPWETGLDPYSGLFEMLLEDRIIVNPSVGWYSAYEPIEGVVEKFRKADFRQYADTILMHVAPSEETAIENIRLIENRMGATSDDVNEETSDDAGTE